VAVPDFDDDGLALLALRVVGIANKSVSKPAQGQRHFGSDRRHWHSLLRFWKDPGQVDKRYEYSHIPV
jgi:hypothetical protein